MRTEEGEGRGRTPPTKKNGSVSKKTPRGFGGEKGLRPRGAGKAKGRRKGNLRRGERKKKKR